MYFYDGHVPCFTQKTFDKINKKETWPVCLLCWADTLYNYSWAYHILRFFPELWGVLPFHGIIALGKTLTRHWFAISACSCPLQFAEETHLNGPRVNFNLFWFSILCVVFRWFKMAYPSRVSFHFGARIWRDRAASWSGQRFTVYVPDHRGRAVWGRIQIRPCRGCILHPPLLVITMLGAPATCYHWS